MPSADLPAHDAMVEQLHAGLVEAQHVILDFQLQIGAVVTALAAATAATLGDLDAWRPTGIDTSLIDPDSGQTSDLYAD